MLEVNNVVAGGLTRLSLVDSGNYSLIGVGTAHTSVIDALLIDLDILEVDGAPITPINASGSAFFEADVLSSPVVGGPWGNVLSFDFSLLLVANNIPFDFGVTKAQVTVHNTLTADSESGGAAFIRKTDFGIQSSVTLNPRCPIPEPSSATLIASLLLCLSLWRRWVAPSI